MPGPYSAGYPADAVGRHVGQVVLALARTAAEAARAAHAAAAPKDAAYTRSMLADLCALLLVPVSPQNNR
jgi:hypothetical protein